MMRVLIFTAALLLTASAQARAEDNEWQVASDEEIICMPIEDVLNGISSPQELSRQIPRYSGQTLRVSFPSDNSAILIDESGKYSPLLMIRGKERCLQFLRRMRGG